MAQNNVYDPRNFYQCFRRSEENLLTGDANPDLYVGSGMLYQLS